MNGRLAVIRISIAFACLCGAAVPAIADIWKCKDRDGRTVYEQNDCQLVGLETIEQINIGAPTADRPAKKKTKRKVVTPPNPLDDEAIVRRTAAAMHLIKKNLRDPESVVWEHAGATMGGAAICITYRAKNGFGGYSREHLLVTDKGGTQSFTQWNKACVGKPLTDFTYAKALVP